MQVNSIDSTASFGSKGSLKRMLKLPGNNPAAKDINKITEELINKVYKKNISGSLEVKQLNRTGFKKSKKELGDLLSVDPQTDALIKDDVINIPFKSIIKLLDIISENMKKPISKLLPKVEKDPSLSKILGQLKGLEIVNADPEVTFMNVFNVVSGIPREKKAVLIPYRELVKNTAESVDELITPTKKELSEQLSKMEKDNYVQLKKQLTSFFQIITNMKNNQNITDLLEQSQIFLDKLGSK